MLSKTIRTARGLETAAARRDDNVAEMETSLSPRLGFSKRHGVHGSCKPGSFLPPLRSGQADPEFGRRDTRPYMNGVKSRISRHLALAAIAGTCALAPSRAAHANAAQRSWWMGESELAGPVAAATPAVVLHEQLSIDCVREPCTFEATYDVENPTAQALTVTGSFYGYGPGRVEVAFAGADAHVTLEEAEQASITERAKEALRAAVEHDYERERVDKDLVAQRDFRFALGPHQRAPLVFRGDLRVIRREILMLQDSYAFPPVLVRHPFLYHSTNGSELGYAYPIAPLRTWGGKPRIDVTVRHRKDRELEVQSGKGISAPGTSTESGDVTTWSGVFDNTTDKLDIRISEPRRDPVLGGPMAAIGGRLDQKEFRLRAGFELTRPAEWAVYSVTVDSNLKNYLTPAVMIEGATPSVFFIIPSLSLGVGMPVRFEKGEPTRVGIRTQLGLQTALLGLVFPVDIYPARGPAGDHVDLSLLGRISF